MIRIIAINSKYVHTLLSPYYLKENCDYKDIDIVQTNINANIDDIVLSAIVDSPVAVAFPTYIFNTNVVEIVCEKIKQIMPNIVIILGGPEVSYEYQDKYLFADCIITGEGEVSFNKVINSIINGQAIERVVTGECVDIDSIKSPYSEDYFRDVQGKIAYFEASRGCPYSCAYCMSGGSRLRMFSLDKVKNQLLKFAECGIRVLKFVDRTFNANKKNSNDLLKFIVDNHNLWGFCFHFEIAADLINQEFLDIVASSPKGLFQFEIGVQSFNNETLKSVVRVTDSNKVVDNIAKILAIGKAHIHTDLIAGLPYEDLLSFKEGFNRLYKLKSNMLQLGFLKVLKGSRIKDMLDNNYSYSNSAPYEIIKTPYLSEENISELKIVEDCVDKYYNSGSFGSVLEEFVTGDPYAFYLELGKRSKGAKSLFDRIEYLYNFLVESNDWRYVRSRMLVDYLARNNSRVIPPVLKIEYNRDFAKLLKHLGINKKLVFAVGILSNPNNKIIEKGILYVDYSIADNSVNYLCWDKQDGLKGEDMIVKALGKYARFAPINEATNGYLLTTKNNNNFMIDFGSGVLSKLQSYIDVSKLDMVILTHLHFDHCSDLGTLGYYMGYNGIKKIKVYLPKTPTIMVEALASNSFDFVYIEPNETIEIDNVKLTFVESKHPVETYSLKIMVEGKTLVYTSDISDINILEKTVSNADYVIGDACILDKDYNNNSPHISVKQLSQTVDIDTELYLAHLDKDLEKQILAEGLAFHSKTQLIKDFGNL